MEGIIAGWILPVDGVALEAANRQACSNMISQFKKKFGSLFLDENWKTNIRDSQSTENSEKFRDHSVKNSV
jgi:hypothetical protein